MPLISPVVPLSVTATGAGPIAISVPSGALAVLVSFRANHGTFAISSNFAGAWTDLTTSGTFTRLFAAPVTNTSAGRTITLNFGGYLSEGCLATVAFFDGVDNSSIAAWIRDSHCEETYEVEVASQPGDLVFGVEFWSTTTAATPPNEAGWTSQLTPTAVNNIGARARTLDTVDDPTSTMSAQYAAGGDYNSLALVSIIPGGGGGSTTITAVTSLAMAVQLARNAAASVGLAVQVPQQATTSVALAIRTARTATTSLDAAIQQARAASALVQLAVQAPQSSSSSVATAVQVARNAAANLDLVIQRAQALGVGVDLQVQTPSAASASVSLQVQVGSTLSTALAIAVQELREASTAVSLAVSQARAQGADASLAVQAGLSGNVTTSLAVQQARTGGASVDMQIQEGATRSAALQAAVQFAVDASASVGLAVAGLRTAGVGLAAAVSLQRALGSVVDLVVLQRQLASLGVSMHIVDSSTFARAPDGPLPQDRFANTNRPGRLSTGGRPTMSNTSRPRR
jgi:hypothetical protein